MTTYINDEQLLLENFGPRPCDRCGATMANPRAAMAHFDPQRLAHLACFLRGSPSEPVQPTIDDFYALMIAGGVQFVCLKCSSELDVIRTTPAAVFAPEDLTGVQ